MAPFELNVVLENLSLSTSVSVSGSDRVVAVLRELDPNHIRQKYALFQMQPGSHYPSNHNANAIAAFVKNFKRAQAKKMDEQDKISEWFKPETSIGEETMAINGQVVLIDDKSVQILILRESVDGTSHSLSLRRQLSH